MIKNIEDTLKFMLHHASYFHDLGHQGQQADLDCQGHGSGFEIEFFLPASNSLVSAGNLN